MSDTLDWPIHPAADLFPPMEGEAFDKLVADIRDNGLIEPVWLWLDPDRNEQVLLDGRNRVRACKRAAAPIRTRAYTGDDPLAFVVSENVLRRHMTVEQLAKVAEGLLPMYAEQAKQRQVASGGDRKSEEHKKSVPVDRREPIEPRRKRYGEATHAAATAVGLSTSMLERYRRLGRYAPDLQKLVDKKKISIDAGISVLRLRNNGHADLAQQVLDGKLTRKAAEHTAAITEPTQPPPLVTSVREERASKIRDLAAQGYSSRQMPEIVGVKFQSIREIARAFDIEIPADKAIGRSRLHDSNRIVQETVNALAGLAMGVDLIKYDDLDTGQVGHWATSLKESWGALDKFRRNLNKKVTE
jgi:ParB-like chromosome segregation protein Spo0J